MKRIMTLASMLLIPVVMLAQTKSFDEDVNSELDRMYDKNRTVQSTQAQAPAAAVAPTASATADVTPAATTTTTTTTTAVPAQAAPTPAAAPVVTPAPAAPAPEVTIIQNQSAAPAPQKQATTVVEAAPLTESKADKLRKAREETELQTEQKIVEKLEQSRMEDEKHRAEVLFGDKFNTLNNPQQPPAAVQATPAPQPAPIVVQEKVVEAPQAAAPAKEQLDREAVRQEVSAALDENKAKEDAKKSENKSYMAILGGMDNYNNTHIQSQYSAGLAYGHKINDRLLVEGQFNFSDNHIQQADGAYYYGLGFYPRITDMQSYQGLFEAKYQFFSGMIRPLVGGAAAYTYRKYNDIQYGNSSDTGDSSAVDVGLLAGVDFGFSESISLGFEVRYMWNIANQTQTNNAPTPIANNSNTVTPENMGYMNMSLVVRYSF